MQNGYRYIIARLNGDSVRRDFGRYSDLVEKGIAGFIVFGGGLSCVRSHIEKLQKIAELPLIIASDLERGLGQQLRGGTPLPPAMALSCASKNIQGGSRHIKTDSPKIINRAFEALAEEAAYAGINTIFAPVLDINTNPKNPIIAARSFGEDAQTVSAMGCAMAKTLQKHGIAACGKHFPGHGDTETDSHISLPVIKRSLADLRKTELVPFADAAEAGVEMIMMAHLSVPAIDSSGLPASLSKKAVRLLKKELGFGGIVITDAMNMGGLCGFSEEKACLMALEAGVDIILHPSDPDAAARYIEENSGSFSANRIESFRKRLSGVPSPKKPDFDAHLALSDRLTQRSIVVSGGLRKSGKIELLLLNDDEKTRGRILAEELRTHSYDVRVSRLSRTSKKSAVFSDADSLKTAAIFSETKGWKGGSSDWLFSRLQELSGKADLLISFGSPYLIDNVKSRAKMFAWWDSESAQRAAARMILNRL